MEVELQHVYFLFFPKTKLYLYWMLAKQNADFYNKIKMTKIRMKL